MWKGFRKITIIVASGLATITTAHHHKLLDRTTFHSFHHLVGKGKHLVVTKATNDFTRFEALRSRTSLSQGYDFREILAAVCISHNVFPSWEGRSVGSKDLVFVGGIGKRRHNAVGGEEYRTIECRKLCTLLPPSITVVAHKVLVFLERWIVVSRKHLAMSVDVYALPFRLFEQLFQIFEIMTTDQDARTVLHVDRDFCHFRVAIGARIGTIKDVHSFHPIFASAQSEVYECSNVKISHCERSQSVTSEVIDGEVFIAKTFGMLHIGSHSLKTIDDQFGERTLVFVSLGQYTHFACFCIKVVTYVTPSEGISGGQFHTDFLQTCHQLVTQF